MASSGFTLFETPIGICGIAWNERGIAGVQLPESNEKATRARIAKRVPGAGERAAPPSVRRAIRSIRDLLGGRRTDLDDLVLDMDGVPPFGRKVLQAARSIPAGRTATYGEIAKLAGSAGSARAVGQALGRNPFPILVPCHRILAAGGRSGGFSARGGVATKKKLLAIEGCDLRPVANARANGHGGAKAKGHREAVRVLRAADARLARIIDVVGPCRLAPKPETSIFAALAEAVVHQQLGGAAARTIHARVAALFPRARGGFGARHILGASDEALRGAGLSRAKVAALRDLAGKVEAGEVPSLADARSMSDDEIIERLTAVRGIGRWTAEMVLMFHLGRGDILPVDDYGVRKGFAVAMRKKDLPSPKDLRRYGEKWKPYRSVASWYLWRACELGPPRRRA